MTTYFENLTVQLYVLYILKMHVSRMFYAIRSIFLLLLFFFLGIILDYKNLKF